jgi:hypothetical protein
MYIAFNPSETVSTVGSSNFAGLLEEKFHEFKIIDIFRPHQAQKRSLKVGSKKGDPIYSKLLIGTVLR